MVKINIDGAVRKGLDFTRFGMVITDGFGVVLAATLRTSAVCLAM